LPGYGCGRITLSVKGVIKNYIMVRRAHLQSIEMSEEYEVKSERPLNNS
jgi:hypothetical protein